MLTLPLNSGRIAWFPRGIVCLLITVLSLLSLSGCSSQDSTSVESKSAENAEPSQKSPATDEVRVKEVKLEVWPETVRVQGSLMGDENSIIGSKQAGLVTRVLVDLGTVVQEGESLVTLDQKELILKVQQAEAQLSQACAAIGLDPAESETELNRENAPPVKLERALLDEAIAAYGRAQKLRVKGAIAEGEFDRLEAQTKTAQARYRSALNSVGEQIALIGVRRVELAVAKQQLEDSEIIAPFTGVVAAKHVSPGEYIEPGQALLDLIRTDRLRFTAGVPERHAENIRLKQTVLVKLPGQENPLLTQISRISPLLTLSSRSLLIEADLANPELKYQAGLFAEAEIVVNPAAESLAVPSQAIAEFAGVQKVWVVQDSVAKEVPIRTKRRDGKRVEVVEGLQPGDVIVKDFAEGRAGEIATVMKTSTTPLVNESVAGTLEETSAGQESPN